jgi:hypothetical protein
MSKITSQDNIATDFREKVRLTVREKVIDTPEGFFYTSRTKKSAFLPENMPPFKESSHAKTK